jgi:hypothetical protein
LKDEKSIFADIVRHSQTDDWKPLYSLEYQGNT